MQRSQPMEASRRHLPAGCSDHRVPTITPRPEAVCANCTRAIDQGVTEEQVRTDYEEAYLADGRLLIKYCTRAMLLDGGWWDATATPPTWAENSFASSHDHYVAVNQSGIPTLANFVTAKRHIQEHGFGLGNSIACFMHGDTVGTIESLPELSTAPGPMPTAIMDSLQRNGLTPFATLSGISIISTDWVPENYAIFVDMARKPLHWRNSRARLRMARSRCTVLIRPTWTGRQAEHRVLGKRVGHARSAGLAMYFSGSSWTDPTISLTA